MKAFGKLPNDPLIKEMTDVQWLWCYHNLQKDEVEDIKFESKLWEQRIEYIGWWINPQLAKRVGEIKKQNNGFDQNTNSNLNVVEGDTMVNTDFEEELKRALKESGTEENLTELPDSQSAGNPYESLDDFIGRVSSFQEEIQNDDLDTIIVPE